MSKMHSKYIVLNIIITFHPWFIIGDRGEETEGRHRRRNIREMLGKIQRGTKQRGRDREEKRRGRDRGGSHREETKGRDIGGEKYEGQMERDRGEQT